jgi:hypothetical protein
MNETPRFTHQDETSSRPRRVRVPGRDDIGEVVDGGKNFGMNPSIYCLGIYFPSTGECVYYDQNRVQDVDVSE